MTDLTNFDPVVIGNQIAELETEAQSERRARASYESLRGSPRSFGILSSITPNISKPSASVPGLAAAAGNSSCRSEAVARRWRKAGRKTKPECSGIEPRQGPLQ